MYPCLLSYFFPVQAVSFELIGLFIRTGDVFTCISWTCAIQYQVKDKQKHVYCLSNLRSKKIVIGVLLHFALYPHLSVNTNYKTLQVPTKNQLLHSAQLNSQSQLQIPGVVRKNQIPRNLHTVQCEAPVR